MTDAAYDVLPTVCLSVVAICAIQGLTVYSVVKMFISGRPVVEKREADTERRVVSLYGER